MQFGSTVPSLQRWARHSRRRPDGRGRAREEREGVSESVRLESRRLTECASVVRPSLRPPVHQLSVIAVFAMQWNCFIVLCLLRSAGQSRRPSEPELKFCQCKVRRMDVQQSLCSPNSAKWGYSYKTKGGLRVQKSRNKCQTGEELPEWKAYKRPLEASLERLVGK